MSLAQPFAALGVHFRSGDRDVLPGVGVMLVVWCGWVGGKMRVKVLLW
jgi:hypothetical protein